MLGLHNHHPPSSEESCWDLGLEPMKPKGKVVLGAASINSWQLICAKTGPGSVLAVIFQAGVNIKTNTAAVLVWGWNGALR